MTATHLGAGSFEVTPGDADATTTLAVWVAALAETNSDVVIPDPTAEVLILAPQCETDLATLELVLYGLFGATWAEIGRLDWDGESTTNPAADDYRLAPTRVPIPTRAFSGLRAVAIGRTAPDGASTWTVHVQQDGPSGRKQLTTRA